MRITWTRCIAPALLLCAAALAGACDSDDGGAPSEPVECYSQGQLLPKDGDPCATPGELCDISGYLCTYLCGDDLIWHDHCRSCPPIRPATGDACDPAVHTGGCGYDPETACGPGSGTIFTCNATTSSWQADDSPCL